MTKLERWARHKFQYYCYQREGITLDWNYLSDARKLVWIGEIVDVYDLVLGELKEGLQRPKDASKPQASYERGFLDGESHENFVLMSKLERLETEIKEQYDSIKEKYAKKG